MESKKVWALVADGAKARIVKNIGHESGTVVVDLASDKQQLGEIMADKAGRSFASAGGRRSPMELKSDPVRDRERAFAAELGDVLDKHLAAGELDSLIVTAEHRMLGDLRKAFSARLQKQISHEVDKNLTGLTEKDLLEAVSDLQRRH